MPLIAPMDAAAIMAREKAKASTGLSDKDIGVFFISPCAAKATTIRLPIGLKVSPVSGVLSMRDVYLRLAQVISKIDWAEPLSTAGSIGISWANSGGEANGLGYENYISADGIANCIKLLDELDSEHLESA
jgi:hypothetical protein